MNSPLGMEIYHWDQPGYLPLVFSHDWQVAWLNWEPAFALPNLGEVERHNQSDEVFVLVKGQAVLFTITDEGSLQIEEMLPNSTYNVTQGSWHNLIATPDASWVIVENRDTHLSDTEFRQISPIECKKILAEIPSWVHTLIR